MMKRSLSLLLLLAAFASAAYYFDAPIVAVPSLADQERAAHEGSHLHLKRRLTVRPKPRGQRHRVATTPPPWSAIPHNGPCSIEVYKVSTTIEKNKFQTKVTHMAYLMKPTNVSNAENAYQHVLTVTTTITKNYTMESVDNIPCVSNTERCKLRHWIYSITKVDVERIMKLHGHGNITRESKDHEKYAYVEKVDWEKLFKEKYAQPSRKAFIDKVYIRDLCRGPGVNQHFECYAGDDGKHKCQCLRDKRPQFTNKPWLKWDKERKMCIAPSEAICAIRETITDYKKSQVQCEEGSTCSRTSGLDDSYVFCSRFDHEARNAKELFVTAKSLSRWKNSTNFLVYLLLAIFSYYPEISFVCLY